MPRDYVPVKAPRGTELTCKSWLTEAPFRMIQHNLEEGVAEDPKNLIVYGGSGKAARNWDCFDAILHALKNLEADETLLVQSGKPVGVFRTHSMAPRVLISNSMLVPAWANWTTFRELEAQGLTMFGQMTAGSWIYIGTQGIVQGTYETFAELARQHYGGSLKGKLVVTAGLGGMGGAQPLAACLAEGSFLSAEVDPERVQKRLDTKYLDLVIDDLDAAIDKALNLRDYGVSRSIGWVGNAATLLRRLVEREVTPDVLTDQTSAHDLLKGYVPEMPLEEANTLRESDPDEYLRRSGETVADHVRSMLTLQQRGAITFDYGNNIRAAATEHGVENAFDFKGFVPLYIRPQFCEGRGPFRWVALSGDPEDIYKTDKAVLATFPEDKGLERWIKMARERVEFQGLPSRICWLGYGERAKFGKVLNQLVRDREVSAPIVIGRDHLDCGSVASPNRETEGMQDGSDAIADWPILNALLNTACGATWVSVHHGGGVGIGYSIHAGMVVVCNGSPEADERLERVLTADPGMGVVRHVDAGYDRAVEVANERGVRVPMRELPQ